MLRYRLRNRYNEFKIHTCGLLVNRRGEVKRKDGYVPKQTKNGKYVSVVINKKNYLVHRLILETFQPQEKYDFNLTCDHINGNKLDNRLRNLRWLSRGENAAIGNTGDKNCNRIDMLNKTPKLGIPVYGINKVTGDRIDFCSIIEAERNIKIKNGIHPVLKGIRKSCGGYYWYKK